MALANSITFGSVTLDGGTQGNWIVSITPKKVPGSLKNRLNQNVTVVEIPGRNKEWQIEISGNLQGANMENDAVTLENYNVGSIRNFTDGAHNGNYIIIDLQINRSNSTKTYIPYAMTIREYTQTV